MNQITKREDAGFSLTPKTLEEAMKFSEILARSTIVPKNYQNRSGDILVAIQMGQELGLKPIQALQNIAVINGKPSIYGDSILALVKAHHTCEDVIETFDNAKMEAICVAKRKGRSDVVQTFNKEKAQKAGLWGKSGPWTQYPERMLQMRARGFALRDQFPDVLQGLILAEEAQDYEVKDVTPAPQANKPMASKADALADILNVETPITIEEAQEKFETIVEEKAAQNKAEAIEHLKQLVDVNAIPLSTIEAWHTKANASKYEDFTLEQLEACIAFVNKKAEKLETEKRRDKSLSTAQ